MIGVNRGNLGFFSLSSISIVTAFTCICIRNHPNRTKTIIYQIATKTCSDLHVLPVHIIYSYSKNDENHLLNRSDITSYVHMSVRRIPIQCNTNSCFSYHTSPLNIVFFKSTFKLSFSLNA